jgi:hypothetical protein
MQAGPRGAILAVVTLDDPDFLPNLGKVTISFALLDGALQRGHDYVSRHAEHQGNRRHEL